MNNYSEAYIDYLIYFHAERDFFECHEVLEEYWKQHPESPFGQTWVGLIQLAVSLYHQRRNNMEGAKKMMAGAIEHVVIDDLTALGLDAELLLQQMEQCLETMKSTDDFKYEDFDLSITDNQLLQECIRRTNEKHLKWCTASDLNNEQLIHKHTQRDRTEVIQTRQQKLIERQF